MENGKNEERGRGKSGDEIPIFPLRCQRCGINLTLSAEGMSDDAVFTAAFFLSRILEFGRAGNGGARCQTARTAH